MEIALCFSENDDYSQTPEQLETQRCIESIATFPNDLQIIITS